MRRRRSRGFFAARPDRESNPSAGAQHSPRLGEGCCRIRHEHVSPAAEDAVDRIVRKLDLLRVQDVMLDVRQTERGTSTAGDFGHRRAEVARDQATALAKDCCNLESDIALAGRQLEHRVAGLRRELANEPFGHGRRGLLPFRPRALPAPGHRSPVLEPGVALLVAVHGAIVDAWSYAARLEAAGSPANATRTTVLDTYLTESRSSITARRVELQDPTACRPSRGAQTQERHPYRHVDRHLLLQRLNVECNGCLRSLARTH